jgi:outer membrane protein assembly factor BamB
MVQNGGILSALDPATGVAKKQGRLTGALGDYYSSPIAADGKLYSANQEGKVSVIQAGAEWELIRVNDLEEEIYATPAIVDGDLYIRTARSFYRFRSAAK